MMRCAGRDERGASRLTGCFAGCLLEELEVAVEKLARLRSSPFCAELERSVAVLSFFLPPFLLPFAVLFLSLLALDAFFLGAGLGVGASAFSG